MYTLRQEIDVDKKKLSSQKKKIDSPIKNWNRQKTYLEN